MAMISFNHAYSYEKFPDFDSSTFDKEFESEVMGAGGVGTSYSKSILGLSVLCDGSSALKVLVDAKGELVSLTLGYTNVNKIFTQDMKTRMSLSKSSG